MSHRDSHAVGSGVATDRVFFGVALVDRNVFSRQEVITEKRNFSFT